VFLINLAIHVLCARGKSDRASSVSVVTKRKSCGKSRITRVSDDSDSADRKSVSCRASRDPEGKANVSKSSRESRHRHRCGGTAAAAPPPFRPGNPALCGRHPLVTHISVA